MKQSFDKSSVCKKTDRGDVLIRAVQLKGAGPMRSISLGVIFLLASTAVVHPAQAPKHAYAQALMSHRQPIPIRREQPIGQTHPDEDALTNRIEQDNIRLDRLIDICSSC
jgi:hypothetical protein